MKLKFYFLVIALFLITAILPAQSKKSNALTKAIVTLTPTEGNNVKGTVTFTKENNGIKIVAEIEGLTPGKHGIHIHEFGDCSTKDGNSAGGHFNPLDKPHGGPFSKDRHVGDLGNITADQNGKANLVILDRIISFEGVNSIIGRALIVHEKEDDFKTQPTGDAGKRLACGVIGWAK